MMNLLKKKNKKECKTFWHLCQAKTTTKSTQKKTTTTLNTFILSLKFIKELKL